jgi:hypothetical protein
VHNLYQEEAMNYYSITLFVHIVGAVGFFVALGVEWLSVRHLRRATTAEQVREWIRASTGVRRLGMASMLMLLLSGFSMMLIAQVGGAWLIVAFWSLVLLSILAVALSFRRIAAIGRVATTEDGPVSSTLRRLLDHPLLRIAIQTRVAVALGIVFLMTVKPDLSGSLLAIGVAAVLGVASALPMLVRERTKEQPAT